MKAEKAERLLQANLNRKSPVNKQAEHLICSTCACYVHGMLQYEGIHEIRSNGAKSQTPRSKVIKRKQCSEHYKEGKWERQEKSKMMIYRPRYYGRAPEAPEQRMIQPDKGILRDKTPDNLRLFVKEKNNQAKPLILENSKRL